MAHEIKYITCSKCGKKVRRHNRIHTMCQDCRVENDLQKRGKAYLETIKREAEEYDKASTQK